MSDLVTRVLVVEDNPDQVEIIRDMLSAAGHRTFLIDEAGRVSTALQKLEHGPVDVVLLDLNLPDSSDLGGVERLHARFPDVPLIVLTNVQDDELAMGAARAGAHDYLLKREISPSLLLRAIRYACERAQAERTLRESEERYSLAVAGARDGIWDWRVSDDRAHFSPRWRAMVGLPPGDSVETIDSWLRRVHPEDVEGLRAALDAHAEGKTDHLEHEHRVSGPDGSYRWVLCRGLAVRDASGRVHRMAGSLSDITQRKQAEAQLLHDALHDALTRLPNRNLFLDRLDQALKRFQRNPDSPFAVMFLDLDRFKTVNDSLGHSVGDELLIGVANRLQRFLRPGDTLARFGGDEFAILLGEVEGAEGAQLVAVRINELMAKPFPIRGHEVFAAASIGIVLPGVEYNSPEEVLRDADLSMYRAKLDPAVPFQIFDSTMRDSVMARHRLETELRRALEAGEFAAHYQPIVCIASGRVRGFEALLRWHHPSWGLLHPEEFLQVAEDTGLVVPIGWWMLEEAARQTRQWQSMFPTDPPLTVSINMSGKLFTQVGVVDRFAEVLERCGLEPASLHVEITESAVLDHDREVVAILDGLRALGVQLNIDDFGTGYASLTYLQRYCYDTLKIDRSFVNSMIEREASNAIVKAILALGASLGMKVIAEGVETPEQLARLRELHCHQAQGFWFSQPLAPSAIGEYLSRAVAGAA